MVFKITAIIQREKSLSENIIIIVVIALLMTSFIYYYFKQGQQLALLGFDNVASKFSAQLTAIRAQWYMDNQPKRLIIQNNHGKAISVAVNQRGWVDFSSEQHNCEKIWQAVMDAPLIYMKEPIIVLTITDKNEQQQQNEKEKNKQENQQLAKQVNVSCQYGLSTGQYFEYQLSTGKVGKIEQRSL